MVLRSECSLVLLLTFVLGASAFLPTPQLFTPQKLLSSSLYYTGTSNPVSRNARKVPLLIMNEQTPAFASVTDGKTTASVRSRIAEVLHSSLKQQVDGKVLEITGTIPKWLKGSLVRNGPALFEVGDEQFTHLFDGQAMLHCFVFDGGSSITYSNKMLKSEHLERHQNAGKIAMREFVSGPQGGIGERVEATQRHMLDPFDNANVCVAEVAGKCVAMTEGPFPMEFDRKTAETIGRVGFDAELELGLLSTAHPITAANGDSYNIMQCLGWGLKDDYYQIYRVRQDGVGADGKLQRELICRVPATGGQAAYMHTFSLSRDHVVLMEFPQRFSLPKLMWDETARIMLGKEDIATSMFTWQPEKGTDFLVVSLRDKKLVGRFHTDEALFTYHPVNCVEDGDGNLHLDITKYEKEVVYPIYLLDDLRQASEMTWRFKADISRYSLKLRSSDAEQGSGAAVSSRVLVDHLCEFPRINNNFRGDFNYRFCYGTGPPSANLEFWRPLVKSDVKAGTVKLWEAAGCAPGEPIFVPNPQAASEDDGVLLSVVLDGSTDKSFLLGLDAATMQEVFRAQLPHHCPAGFHGEWFGDRADAN